MRSSLTLFAVLLLAVPGMTYPFTTSGTAQLWFSTSGTANPDLNYHFSSIHQLTIQSHNFAETAAPLQMVGSISHKPGGPFGGGGQTMASCSQIGTVGNLFFFCQIPSYTAFCPGADGTWFARTVYITPIQAGGYSSGPTIANCPPPGGPQPCGSGVPAGLRAAIDLETGTPIDPSLAWELSPLHLGRSEVHSGKEYLLDEWAVVAVAPEDDSVGSASSEASRGGGPSWAATLRKAQAPVGSKRRGTVSVRRYLVIQAPVHFGHLRPPLAKFHQRLVEEGTLVRGQRVVIRAAFSGAGRLQEVQVIEGAAEAGQRLAGALELVFPDSSGHRHRVAVYAVFEGLDEPELISAIPVYPQCCCGEFFCV